MKVFVMNGPNLNMLGIREPDIYGHETLKDIEQKLLERAKQLHVEIDFFQSNSEGALIDKIQDCYGKADGIIINPGAYSHYSLAIRDAIKSVSIKTVEVHISNVFAREEIRSNMITAPASLGVISGFGSYGYLMALDALVNGEK